MGSPDSYPKPIEADQPFSLDTHGDIEVTREGVTLPLRTWLKFCPVPIEEMDPAKLEEYGRAFLEGKEPVPQEKN